MANEFVPNIIGHKFRAADRGNLGRPFAWQFVLYAQYLKQNVP